MPYNSKQYNAALAFVTGGDGNVTNPSDKRRLQVYDLYENLVLNSMTDLKVTVRGDDSYPILIPTARKIVNATGRFLGQGFDYFVEPVDGVDAGSMQTLDDYMKDWFKRESVAQKFASNKHWGLVRGDAVFYLYGNFGKDSGSKVSIAEVDPRQIFRIEDPNDSTRLLGYHIVEVVQDFREADNPAKQVAKRRTFRKEVDSETFLFTGVVTTELTYWEVGEWDDRDVANFDPKKRVPGGLLDEEETELPELITELPVYHWRNDPMQNTSWGTSQLAGFETCYYAINQSITDEDATIVFQGLGMYVTSAKPPLDPNDPSQVTDWNIGPGQIIEIGDNQKFERVTGVTDVSPFTNHMDWINDRGIQEGSGISSTAMGRVDVNVVASGIALKMDLMPLLAANAEKELEFITVLDQMFHDLATMWLPAYEAEIFADAELASLYSLVCVFDDPMPVDRDSKIQETLLLRTSNLILTSMAVAKLRELGWEYPTSDPETGEALDDQGIADLLSSQAMQDATNSAGSLGGFDDGTGGGFDDGSGLDGQNNGNTPPSQQQIPLG